MRLVIVLDSVSYETFMKANCPNMKSVGIVHKALSHGSWTLPSFASMLVNIFPACTVKGCKHRELIKPDIFYTKHNRVAVLTNNPWIEMLAKGMGTHVVRVTNTFWAVVKTHDLFSNLKFDVVFIHVMETHFQKDKEWSEEIQIYWLEKVDECLYNALNLADEVIITADHGENFGEGERHGMFDGIFRREVIEVPIIWSEVV